MRESASRGGVVQGRDPAEFEQRAGGFIVNDEKVTL